MSTLSTILDALTTLVEAVVPTHPGRPFVRSQGAEAVAGMPKDDAYERSFRWVPVPGLSVGKPWGDGSAPEVDKLVELQIGYVAAGDDRDMALRIASDEEQIVKALQTSGVALPVTVTNIRPEGPGSLVDTSGTGMNSAVYVWRWRLTYDLT